MLKVSNKVSITLSLIVSVVVAMLCCGGSVFLPRMVSLFCSADSAVGRIVPAIVDIRKPVVLALCYVAVAAVLAADILLIWLLLRVRTGLVFTDKSIALVRAVSWCCMLLCATLAVIGLKFSLSLVIACLALFLGLCLRVVKNVLTQAAMIKSENDLTV